MYASALEKLGLEPNEFEKLLNSKMEKLFNCKATDLRDPVKESIINARECFCIRETISNPGHLDERYRIARRFRDSVGKYVGPYLLTDPKKSPGGIERETRVRGDTNLIESDRKQYHLGQAKLFRELQKQGKLDSRFDDDGYLLKDDGERCSTVSMCNELDSITRDIKVDHNELSRESLDKLFLLCSFIVIGRISVDWATANDLMSVDEYKQWKDYVWALMTFAALSVVIDDLSRLPKYGSNSLFKFYSQPLF